MSKRTINKQAAPTPLTHLLHPPSKKEDSEQILVSKGKRWKNAARIHFTLSCPLATSVCCCLSGSVARSTRPVVLQRRLYLSTPSGCSYLLHPHPTPSSSPTPSHAPRCLRLTPSTVCGGTKWCALVERYENVDINYITCTEVCVCVCVGGVHCMMVLACP